MYRRIALLVGGLVLLAAASSSAQDAILGQMLGSGIHAYFSQDYAQAYESFSSAVNGGIRDPRCYYFRGLALLKLGREEAARTDFQKGAELESADVNRTFNVARSLERVQGSGRALLEQYRVEARMIALQREEALRKQRYEANRQEQARVLQQQVEEVPAAPATPMTKPADKTPADAFQTGPIEESTKPAAEKAPAAPAVPEQKPAAAPGEQPAAKPVVEDPFATTPAEKPAAKPAEPEQQPGAAPAVPEEKPAAAPAEQPPAKPAPEDPFATTPAEKPAAKPAEPAQQPGAAANQPAAGQKKSGGLLGAVGKALGKAVTGDSAAGAAAPAPAAAAKPAPAAGDPFAK